ncbi:MAG: glycoside hydrolase family 43 protein [Longimicrobiales bacterium]
MKKLTALLLIATGALLAAWRLGQRTTDPQFDWFRYQGNDPVYQQTGQATDQYRNPILPGFYPDPSILRVGSDYYLVNSSFSYFPGVPIFHSRDLVNWTQIGHVLERPSQLNLDSLGISQGIYAPALRYHDGTFYLITTLIGRGGNFLVTSRAAAGPWSDPVFLEFDGIDPSIFFDDDGRAWILNNGPPEGSPLYDIAAEGGTGEDHSEVVFRSRNVRGPYQPYPGNPILTQRHLDARRPFPVTSTGHADFVQTQNGDWWAVFLGVRPYADNFFNTGRETFLLPVRWKDDWPIILEGAETVPYAVDKPKLPAQPAGNVQNGNFTERDDFDGKVLKPYWQFIRTPRERWYDFERRPGWLTLQARAADVTTRAQPSLIARRQQHMYASVSTALHHNPIQPGERVGLVAFQNDLYFYCLCVSRLQGQTMLVLERYVSSAGPALFTGDVSPQAHAQKSVLASAPLKTSAMLFLKIEARAGRYDFAYAFEPEQWTVLQRDVDGKMLSSMGAGGFVGTMFGLYAFRPER